MKRRHARLGSEPRPLSPLLRDTKATLLVKSNGNKTLCCTRDEVKPDSKSNIFNDPSVLALNMSGGSYHNIQETSTRQRLRPWLESRINSRDIAGLEWVNKKEKVFKVPWKHVGNREWSTSDATIFKEWAIHTGRYREGVDTPDYPTWKTRFRCALTKLPDIQELKQYNNLDGQIDEPYRVYMFISKNKETNEFPTIHNIAKDEPSVDMMYDDVDGHVGRNGDAIPVTVVHDINRNSEEMLDSDLNHISTGDLIQYPSSDVKQLQANLEDMETTDTPDIQTYDEINRISQKPFPGGSCTMMTSATPPKLSLDPNDKKLYIIVRYRQQVVHEGLVSNDNGCRIYHNPNIHLNFSQEEYKQIFGPVDAQPINLPDCSTNNETQYNMTTKLLNVTDRGVFVSVENGDVYATRKCRCTIFVSSPSINGGDTFKLVREQKTKIFDLHNYFHRAVDRYLHQRESKPSAEVVLGFGQKFDSNKDPLNNLLISVTIVHAEANNLLTKIACTEPLSPTIEISKSDSYDRRVDMIQFENILSNFAY